jgi:hypothetical protein
VVPATKILSFRDIRLELRRARCVTAAQAPNHRHADRNQPSEQPVFQNTVFNRVSGQEYSGDLNCDSCFDPNKDLLLNPGAWVNPTAGTLAILPQPTTTTARGAFPMSN